MNGLFVGITTVDLLYPVDKYPDENTKQHSQGQIMDIGGPATNAAFAFSMLGGTATLVSLIGQHAFSDFMKDKLTEYGIRHIDLRSDSTDLPVISAILVNIKDGSRTIVTEKPKPVIDSVSPELDLMPYDILCVDGFYSEFVLGLLQRNQQQIPVVFDGGSYKAGTDQMLKFVTYPIFGASFQPPDCRNLSAYILEKGIKSFAITKGHRPVQVFDEGHHYELDVDPVEAVDTLGAGDIFHGAFSKFIIDENLNFSAALQKAITVASLSCSFLGPRHWANVTEN
ncbi:MAG: PfkB family carbohydrate kinase [Saprospiraceae bacterium]|nr:PfkB family carbohydrate kinase [Saprospiraceae bacterium]